MFRRCAEPQRCRRISHDPLRSARLSRLRSASNTNQPSSARGLVPQPLDASGPRSILGQPTSLGRFIFWPSPGIRRLIHPVLHASNGESDCARVSFSQPALLKGAQPLSADAIAASSRRGRQSATGRGVYPARHAAQPRCRSVLGGEGSALPALLNHAPHLPLLSHEYRRKCSMYSV
jgi:hypothetical protein